jgi:hypothetical protein
VSETLHVQLPLAPRPIPNIPQRFNEIKIIIFCGIAMKWRKLRGTHTPLHELHERVFAHVILCCADWQTQKQSLKLIDELSPSIKVSFIYLMMMKINNERRSKKTMYFI